MDRAKRRMFSRAGAFVRRRAKSSIRTSKNYSAPGKPPRQRTGSRFRQSILFAFDRQRESVVIGPFKYGKSTNPPAPELLEHGGSHMLKRDQIMRVAPGPGENKGRVIKTGKRVIPLKRGTVVKYEPRPFMFPALKKEAEAGTFPKQIANKVHE